jgi:uncharacterized protein YndB with AHSA1/START domain
MSTNEMKMWALIEKPIDEVWSALTTSEGVEGWLAQEATIELREGGAFHLRSATPLCTGEHVVRHVARNERLGLDWQVLGHSTTVELRLEAAEGGTKFHVAHSHSGDPALHIDKSFENATGMFGELWMYLCGLLKTRLELGEAKGRLDPNRAPAKMVRHVVRIEAAPADVFALIDDPENVPKWNPFAAGAANDRAVGGKYSFGWESEAKGTDGPHEITEYEAGRKITYRWYGDPPTLVSWSVEPMPGSDNATRLTLTHSGFDVDRNMLIGWNMGWAAFLQQIVLHLERGTAPTWAGF